MHHAPAAHKLNRLFYAFLLCAFFLSTAIANAQVAPALDPALSAAAVGRGASTAAEKDSPLDAAEGNPAEAATINTHSLEVGGIGAVATGSFQNSVDRNGTLSGNAGVMPYAAFATPVGIPRLRLLLAFTPDLLMRANWSYIDPPGTVGVTYGLQKNESQILALRSSIGAAVAITPHWSVGATLGSVYNANTLDAPYIFQQQPQLAGLKVLLNLHTTGFGWNGSAGTLFQPTARLRIGAAWKSSTYIVSHGTATGSASALFTAISVTASPAYQYSAEVDNHLPQVANLGASFNAARNLRLIAEAGWTNWGNAFQQLPVNLTNGTNAVINSVAGSSALQDAVPLHWHDQAAFHLGAEIHLAKASTLRCGYAYTSDPVPNSTLTPLTAAILQNTLAAGVGTAKGHWRYDLAYQVQLPSSRSVMLSSLQAGEYDNSHVRVSTQSVVVTTRVNF
jgi:long-subunit fatty acid transport protein